MWAEQVDPFGELRMDYNFARIVQMVHNVAVQRDHQKDLDHFLLKFIVASEESKQPVEQQVQVLNILAMAFGAA